MPELEPIFFFSAFFAGVFMFLAPCTLPLLPAYLGFISGVTERELAEEKTRAWARKQIFRNSVMFVMGFSAVLIFSGITAGYFGGKISIQFERIFEILGGLLIIVFGLFMVGLLKLSFLQKERRVKIPAWLTVGTPVSSLLLGVAFAIGWTPCLGPVYGTILIYAGNTTTVLSGALLLAVFSIGFSLPLLALALLVGQATRFVERAVPYLHIISRIGGIFLVMLGITLLLGHTQLTNWFYHLLSFLDFEEVLLPYL